MAREPRLRGGCARSPTDAALDRAREGGRRRGASASRPDLRDRPDSRLERARATVRRHRRPPTHRGDGSLAGWDDGDIGGLPPAPPRCANPGRGLDRRPDDHLRQGVLRGHSDALSDARRRRGRGDRLCDERALGARTCPPRSVGGDSRRKPPRLRRYVHGRPARPSESRYRGVLVSLLDAGPQPEPRHARGARRAGSGPDRAVRDPASLLGAGSVHGDESRPTAPHRAARRRGLLRQRVRTGRGGPRCRAGLPAGGTGA